MNHLQKWKMETLWQKYFHDQDSFFDFSGLLENYEKGISKYFPKFHLVTSFAPKLSSNEVFFDENGIGYFGIKEYQTLLNPIKKPISLFDNHHVALFPFLELKEFSKNSFDVVHIDAHRDDALFHGKIPKNLSLQNIGKAISDCRVSDYLDYATRTEIIGKISSITQSFEFEAFQIPKKPYILNLDLDIFGEEGECVDLEIKIKVIAKAWSKADAVLLATSPGFMDQEFAFELVSLFC